jgi:predicted ATP-dependent serine protease
MIACETCGKPTSFVFTGRCRNCLTVETLLHEYLRSETGREFVELALERARNGG